MGTVRFTGERTGLREVSVYPFGLIKVGDTIEVDDETAERWTTPLPTAEHGSLEDLENRWNKEELQVIARDHRLDDSGTKAELAKRIYAVHPAAAGQVSKSDFEKAGSGQPTVVPFADREAPPPPAPEGSLAADNQDADTGEGA